MNSEAAINPTWVRMVKIRRRVAEAGLLGTTSSLGASVVIVHPIFGSEEGEGGEQGNQRQQHPGESRGIPHAEEAERLLVKVERVEQRRVDRIARAAGNDEGGGKALERLDRLDDGVEEHHRGQK